MTTIAGVGTKFTTDNKNNEQDMPNHRVQPEKEKGKRRSRCEEIREEHTREIRNHIETGKRRIWHKAPLQVYKEPTPPSTFLRKENHRLYRSSPSPH
jgi:hypothetical protein